MELVCVGCAHVTHSASTGLVFLLEKELKLIAQCFQTFTFPGKIKRLET